MRCSKHNWSLDKLLCLHWVFPLKNWTCVGWLMSSFTAIHILSNQFCLWIFFNKVNQPINTKCLVPMSASSSPMSCTSLKTGPWPRKMPGPTKCSTSSGNPWLHLEPARTSLPTRLAQNSTPALDLVPLASIAENTELSWYCSKSDWFKSYCLCTGTLTVEEFPALSSKVYTPSSFINCSM